MAEKKIGELYIFESPELVERKELKDHSIHGMVDLELDYDTLHSIYTKNTKKVEDGYFSQKITVAEKKDKALYHIVYDHWLAGELFKLEEKHQKVNKKWWPCSTKLVFPKKEKTNMWIVEKNLIRDTKNSWIGKRLEHLQMMFAFIDMGNSQSRLFFHMVVDAQGCRTTNECKKQMRKTLGRLLSLVEKHQEN
ncbi:hypothetical protein [Candidatus Uabimicrobium amorphum]|uniref:hypothetical protein n=1 Tax=Uabimicrobium amorphum TaxID=2596890 RepID=UPI00125F86D4|nr:hypothetical protein [Candidatus Uabimicrobium amorphum]